MKVRDLLNKMTMSSHVDTVFINHNGVTIKTLDKYDLETCDYKGCQLYTVATFTVYDEQFTINIA